MHACPRVVAQLFAGDERVLRRYLEVPLNALSYRGFLLWLAGRLRAVRCGLCRFGD